MVMWITRTIFLFTVMCLQCDKTFSTSNYSNCATSLSTLERALYETDGNLLRLNEVFYPPSLLPTRFVKVNYNFVDKENGTMACTDVTYIWAVGEILFLQPPTLFKFHSLFFYFRNNELTVLNLTLPFECMSLITMKDDECSCSNDSVLLDVLTQQLNVYAKFTKQENVQRSNTFARAVCGRELFDRYHSGIRKDFTYIIVAATIVGPFLLLLLLALAAILSCFVAPRDFIFADTKKKRLIALIVVGTLISVYIFILDILAADVVWNFRHEYANEYEQYIADNTSKSRPVPVNLWVTYWTLSCDVLFIIFFIVYSIVILIDRCKKGDGIREWLKCQVPLPFDLLLLTPAACFISHLGYIMLAWLTEPSRSTTTLILYYFIFFYLFILTQKSYKVMEKHCYKAVEESEDNATSDNSNFTYTIKEDGNKLRISKDVKLVVSLLISTIFGIFYLGIAVVFIMIVYIVPLASDELFNYLFNVIQFIIILISTQFAYKFLSGRKFTWKRIVKTMKKEILVNGSYKNYSKDDGIAKVAGKFAVREILNPLIKRINDNGTDKNSSQEGRGNNQGISDEDERDRTERSSLEMEAVL